VGVGERGGGGGGGDLKDAKAGELGDLAGVPEGVVLVFDGDWAGLFQFSSSMKRSVKAKRWRSWRASVVRRRERGGGGGGSGGGHGESYEEGAGGMEPLDSEEKD